MGQEASVRSNEQDPLKAHQAMPGVRAAVTDSPLQSPPTPDSDLRSPGAYRTVATELRLLFNEPYPARMEYHWHGEIECVLPTRFFERRSGWTGHGVQGPPNVRASSGERQLRARRHGPIYRAGDYENYLVDLGETIDPREHVTIVTNSLYVDEAESFQPYLSSRVSSASESLVLSIEVAHPIKECKYRAAVDGEIVSERDVEPRRLDGRIAYTVTVEGGLIGRHSLVWQW